MQLDWAELLTRLFAAIAAGMIIGLDREWRHKAAGMRTHMLVALGAAGSRSSACKSSTMPRASSKAC